MLLSNVYNVQITATATDGTVTETTTKDVTITVTNVVETPVFTSGATASVAENITATGYMAAATEAGATFSLAAGVKDNDLFEITSGALSFKTAPDFENPRDIYSSTTPPLATAGDNIYEIEITATAGATARSITKNVWITVTNVDEIAPTITSDLAVSVPENTQDFTYTITANETATFALGTAGGDEALFKLEGAKVSFIATPDFETPKDADKNNVYKLELKATDAAGNTGKKVLSITVTDVAEQATIALPEALAFADTKVGETVSKVLTISNPSAVVLKVTAITLPTGFTDNWQSGTIAAGGQKLVKVSFKPTEAKAYTGTITVTSDAANAAKGGTGATEGKNTLSVSGKGILITAIEPQSIFPGLNVFPNPAEDVLNIKLPNQTLPVSVQLVDVNGQVAYEQEPVTGDKLSIDVSGYRSGVYVLVLRSGGKAVQRKVVIQ